MSECDGQCSSRPQFAPEESSIWQLGESRAPKAPRRARSAGPPDGDVVHDRDARDVAHDHVLGARGDGGSPRRALRSPSAEPVTKIRAIWCVFRSAAAVDGVFTLLPPGTSTIYALADRAYGTQLPVLTRLLSPTGRTVRANGVKVHWVEAGDGPGTPLVLRMASATRTSRGRRSSRRSRSRRVLVPDLCGHGLSGRPMSTTRSTSTRTIARWLEAACPAGRRGGSLLWRWRRAVDAALPVASRAQGRPRLGGRSRPRGHDGASPASTPFWWSVSASPSWRRARSWPADRHPRRVLDARAREALAAERRLGTARAFARTVRDVIDLRGQRRGFHQHAHDPGDPPIGLFWGDSDPIIPIEHGIEAERTIPGATLACFARCGHYPHRERRAPSSTRCRPSSTARTIRPPEARCA